MKYTFDIRPYLGAEDLRFGMSSRQVSDTSGPPVRSIRNHSGGLEEYREGLKVVYSQASDTATDFVFFPPAVPVFEGTNLFASQDILSFLMQHDAAPMEGMGIVVFFKLGITVTGAEDTENPDRAITVFAEGRWDSLRENPKPKKVTGTPFRNC